MMSGNAEGPYAREQSFPVIPAKAGIQLLRKHRGEDQSHCGARCPPRSLIPVPACETCWIPAGACPRAGGDGDDRKLSLLVRERCARDTQEHRQSMRAPDAAQRKRSAAVRRRSGAVINEGIAGGPSQSGSHVRRSRFCSAPLRVALRPGHARTSANVPRTRRSAIARRRRA